MSRNERSGPLTQDPPREDSAYQSTSTVTLARQAEDYARAMRARRPPLRPVVYLSMRPALARRPAWESMRAAIERQLPGVRLADFPRTFTTAEDYEQRWPKILEGLAGLVVVPDLSGNVGQCAAREVRQAMATRLPVLMLGPRGLLALAECRLSTVPEPERTP